MQRRGTAVSQVEKQFGPGAAGASSGAFGHAVPYMPDWKTVQLGVVCTLQRGMDLPKRLRNEGEFPLVTSSGIDGTHSVGPVKSPGVITGRYGTIGKVFFVASDFWPLNTTLYVRDFHGNDARFVYYLLQTVDFQSHSGKSGVPGVNRNDVHQEFVQIPIDRHEQETISQTLLDADALIDSLEQLLTKKRQIKQGAMQELLNGKRRLPGFEARWQNRPIKALADIQRGASPRPIDDPVWFDDSSSVGWVRISDVTQSGMYLNSTIQRLSEAGIRKSRFVHSGNLIMSICATVGRPIITELNTCIHDGFVVFDALKIDKKFLYYALLNIEDDWSKHGQTGSQMNLNTNLINGTEIPVPDDPEEQVAIALVLADMDAELATLESRLTKARALKQAMAQALLTGRIRLVEPTA